MITDIDIQKITQALQGIFATKDDLKSFATKNDLKSFATKNDLKSFATKDDLKSFATKDDLKSFATKDDLKRELSNYATKNDLRNELTRFATKDDLSMLEEKMEKKFEMYTNIITKEVNNTVTIFCEKMDELLNRMDRIESKIGLENTLLIEHSYQIKRIKNKVFPDLIQDKNR